MKELIDALNIDSWWQLLSNPFLFALLIIFIIYLDYNGWFRKKIFRRKRSKKKRDPVRLYTPSLKAKYADACNDRCEGGEFLFRCKNRMNLQGDHWYPHANGGATTPRNLVMLCKKCNGSKSNKIPAFLQTVFLGMRRRISPDYKIRLSSNIGQYYPRWFVSQKRIDKTRHIGGKDLYKLDNAIADYKALDKSET